MMASEVVEIPIERVHLFENNPRHGYIADPDKIIERLLDEEQVYELAKSIAAEGTNPLQLVGVVRIDDEDEEGEPTYVVYEGNRRVCAIMLLNDPDRAPAKWVNRFQKLAENTDSIETIDGRIFEDKNVLRAWMANIHNRNQKGRGRREWGPDEQHRFNPTKKYAIAFDLLEKAEAAGVISASDRRNRLTTLQRYVEKDALREILQADDSNPKPGKVKFDRSKADLDKLIKQLVEDLLSENEEFSITSRKNEGDIASYAATLEDRAGVKPVEDQQVDDDEAHGEGGGGTDDENDENENEVEGDDYEPPAPKPYRIKSDTALRKAIAKTKNDKLIDLYKSVTTVSARANPQLVAVGCWSLIETIAAVCGAKEDQAFPAFFNKDRLQNKLGYPKTVSTSMTKALGDLAKAGNTTKHDAISATFDAMQLINDMERVSPMLAKALNQVD